MKVEMTKAAVIRALKSERLVAGRWVETSTDVPCAVCAVGAVVRACVAARTTRPRVLTAVNEARGAWRNPDTTTRLLMKLSDVYEDAVARDVSDRFDASADMIEAGRAAAIAHARKHFPARVQIDIGSAKPRRGMRVVKP